MFFYLSEFKEISILFNVFRYLTFRSAGASVTAFVLTLLFGPIVIRWLKNLNALSHNQREHAESIHSFYAHKNKVPTMGGVLIVSSVLISSFLWGDLGNRFIWILMGSMFAFGLIGFVDDWLKLRYKNSKGIKSRFKLLGQLCIGIAIGFCITKGPGFDSSLHLPFLKGASIPLGFFFIPFVILVLVGSSNALNLTDGLDGLAIGCTLFTMIAFGVISYVVGRVDYTSYLGISYIPNAGEISVFCSALVGASAGFLWFNCYPAEVMMGDTGSLSIGGVIGTIAVLIKKEAILVIVGGVFVWEALSVILQVTSFKLTGKRIFLMSPFHHHLQLKGWPESKVTIRLWIVAMILAVIGLSTLKLR